MITLRAALFAHLIGRWRCSLGAQLRPCDLRESRGDKLRAAAAGKRELIGADGLKLGGALTTGAINKHLAANGRYTRAAAATYGKLLRFRAAPLSAK